MKITREWITPITTGAFLLVAVTGVLLFFHADTGLNREVHEWLSWLFLTGAVLHLAVNFTTFKKYLAQRKGQVLLGLFVLLLAVSFAPFGNNEPSFAPPLHALAEVPLTTLAEVARTSPDQLLERLNRAGISAQSAGQSLNELIGDDFHTQIHILETLFTGKH